MDAPVSNDPHDAHARSGRSWLAALVVAWGAQAIVTQALLLREALTLMFGSELAWGIVLFAWLFGIAVGAAAGGRLAESRLGHEHTAVALAIVLLALSVAACVELWIFRGARTWLAVGPGELLPLPKTALAALLFVSPASALVGLSFPLACRVGTGSSASAPSLTFAQVYALESAGSLIGGAAFSFWAVEHLNPIQIALACGAITTGISAAALLCEQPLIRSPAAVAARTLILASAAATLLAIFAGDLLYRQLIERRWQSIAPGYVLVTAAETKYQNLALGRRADQFTLYCDGRVAVDFPDPYTNGPLAQLWMCEHPAPRRVLLLGGGAEGLLAEMLRHPVEHIDYVEPDPKEIELIAPYLPDVDRTALTDPRVSVHHIDARYYVKTQSGRFDLVIARLPEPTSALRARFYTTEFFGELRRAMTPRAVLCLTATAAPAELPPLVREYLASLRTTIGLHFPEVIIGWGDPAQILAATVPGLLTTDPDELKRRYAARGIQAPHFDPAWFAGATDWLSPDKLDRRDAELAAVSPVLISTDLRPSIYVQRLALWEAQSSGQAPSRHSAATSSVGTMTVMGRLRAVPLPQLALALALLGASTLIYARFRYGRPTGWARGALTLSVGTTGFTTMALSIVWLFAFQNLYGYVYQRIGWIIALFMAGLVAGCLWGGRRDQNTERRRWRNLVYIDVLLALLAVAVPVILLALGRLRSTPASMLLVETCISLLVVATGLLGGAAFALAGRLQMQFVRRPGAAASTVVGADHAGACLGALLCGLLLVPVFGTAATALLLAAMKLSSAALLAQSSRLPVA